MREEQVEQLTGDKLNHLERLLTVKQLQINSLLEVSQAINNNFSTSALYRIFEFILRAQMGVQRLVVFIKNDTWECVCNSGVEGSYENLDVVELLSPFKHITNLNDLDNEGWEEFDVIIPVYHKENPLSYVLIGDLRTDDNDSLEEKLKFIQTITNIVIVAVENKKLFNNQVQQEVMKKELELAAKMQAMLIPSELPNDANVEMAAVYLPHHDIGGDYYDAMAVSDNEIAFCIGDISGKGIAAALLMSNFQANIRSLAMEADDLEVFIRKVNEKVNHITQGEKFITFFFGIYNTETRMLQYVNAGHNPSLLYYEGTITELENGCTLLGMFDELPTVTYGEIKIEEGTVLINYTDGLIDFENEQGEFFGLERVLTFLENHHNEKMETFNNKLLDYVTDFKGQSIFVDDITILSCRFF